MPNSFSEQTYHDAIFSSKLPSGKITPFKRWKHSPYYNVEFCVPIIEDIKDISDYNLCQILAIPAVEYLPVFVMKSIVTDYMGVLKSWFTGFNYIPSIVESAYSRIQWSSFRATNGGTLDTKVLNLPQVLWVHLNTMKDKTLDNTYTSDMFDYLSMMVNPDMYKKLQDLKENSKENSNFTDMHNALRLGDTSYFDEIIKGAQE